VAEELAAVRAKQAEVAARRQGRRDAMKRLWSLADKRRRKLGLLAGGFLLVQFICWVSTPDWGVRVAVLLVSLFALPVVTVLAS
jgi:hypothetical protein